jgi:tetratricopeptide (TPR) repeat protein
MTNYAAGTKLSDLSLAVEPAPAAEPSAAPPSAPARVAAAPPSGAAGSNDGYLGAASREFDAGNIDQALWAKALELAGNNSESAKPAYLRARAAALWVAKRNESAGKTPSRARTSSRDKKPAEAPSARPRRRSPSKPTMQIAGVLGVIVVVAAVAAMLVPSEQPTPIAESKPTPRVAPRKPGPPSADSERVSASGDDFSRKVSELKAAGNWNVLVLYAVEWTRKAPANPDAWNELGIGYVKLRQFNDALEAANKAAQLAPKNAQAWQNLGEINVALQQPAAALAAYERAVALNERDVASLVQMGMLHAELGHLLDAKAAFARVLAMNPLDADALCGTQNIALKEGRPKDAEAIGRQLKASDLRCRDAAVVVPVTVTAGAEPKKKSAASAAR